ncbi:hypothetical protein DYBT9275_04817 [Dyadobacter sp. CECT 9275]|uniref:Reverse transcriptase domain-containing protein n=1 Tax=Dyadobacter helix TaxID=2822344 RepID=A0A916JHE0_9BACT|nr:antiviral reverse transcriptase Drt3a [Dyadobacter sp. CECT 9275]CAG5010799.1 hypothetical protein DYBT9275_04817 [Dyadobacter sp. CECT 9275]
MLDQSFSPENFQKIIDLENRKGNYLVGKFFPNIVEIDNAIKEEKQRTIIRTKRLTEKDFTADLDVDIPKTFDLERLRENRDQILHLELQKISAEIDQPDYKIGIECDITISDKPVYKTTKSIESILILKQLQYNLRKIYKVKQSNRFSIVNNVKILLSDGFPKIILKTDIKGFYENIPQKELLRKINNENLLTLSSRRIISQVLREYNDLTKNTTGVPRGIGISPYLVELYMRDIDSRIKNLAGVMYYARYVDDIIVIYTPSDSISPQAQKEKIKVIRIHPTNSIFFGFR